MVFLYYPVSNRYLNVVQGVARTMWVPVFHLGIGTSPPQISLILGLEVMHLGFLVPEGNSFHCPLLLYLSAGHLEGLAHAHRAGLKWISEAATHEPGQ